GLVVRELEDLGDPLADLLMRGPPGQCLLAHRGDFPTEVLSLVKCPREPLLEVADLGVAACYEVVNLAAGVAAHLPLQLFMQEIGQKVTICIHGITRIFGSKGLRGWVRCGSRPTDDWYVGTSTP